MPEEKDKVENLVDVGEADQQATEVNLDDKGEPEKVETPAEEKIEVEQVPEDKSFENERETKLEKKEDSDELKEYSDGVQKRIAKLTRKMREAERQREEAVQFAQAAKMDKDRLEKNAIILVDDYNFINQEGVKKAVSDLKIDISKGIQTQSGQLILYS